jgi:hypothetical protein
MAGINELADNFERQKTETKSTIKKKVGEISGKNQKPKNDFLNQKSIK